MRRSFRTSSHHDRQDQGSRGISLPAAPPIAPYLSHVRRTCRVEVADRRPRQVAESHRPWPEQSGRKTLRLLLEEGGPGFCQFALNNACNARCGFCGFALDKLPRESWQYVEREGALEAIDILYREAVRYLVLTGGEPMLHPDLLEIVQYRR